MERHQFYSLSPSVMSRRFAFNMRPQIPRHLFYVTRSQFALIKCLHHARILKHGIPKTWLNTARNWTNNIRPAFAESSIYNTLRECTNICINSMKQVFQTHYEQKINNAFDILFKDSHLLTEDLFNKSVSMAIHWAIKQLGRKLRQSTIDDCLDIFYFRLD